MNHGRANIGCGVYHSSAHLGRPVIVTAGGGNVAGMKSSEIWDFTVPGSQWQLGKNSNVQPKTSPKTSPNIKLC
jgi:hypothetical protein